MQTVLPGIVWHSCTEKILEESGFALELGSWRLSKNIWICIVPSVACIRKSDAVRYALRNPAFKTVSIFCASNSNISWICSITARRRKLRTFTMKKRSFLLFSAEVLLLVYHAWLYFVISFWAQGEIIGELMKQKGENVKKLLSKNTAKWFNLRCQSWRRLNRRENEVVYTTANSKTRPWRLRRWYSPPDIYIFQQLWGVPSQWSWQLVSNPLLRK